MFQSKFSGNLISRAALAALLSAPVVLLTGCGGGGGGGDEAPVSQLVISQNNAQPVAAEAVDTATNYETTTAGASLFTGVQLQAAGRSSGPVLLAAASRKLIPRLPDAPALATGVTATESFACTGGGSMTATVTAASDTGIVAGDSFSLSASNCTEVIDGVSMRMNGSMSLTVTGGGYSDPFAYPQDVSWRIAANNFSIVQGAETSLMNGTLDMRIQDSSASAGVLSLSSPSLTTKVTTASGTHSVTVKDYSVQVGVTGTSTTMQMSATVETDSSRLGTGRVGYAISTPTALVANSTGVLTAGSIKVTGSASALLLTVTGPDAFSLQVDTNGDGTYESTTSVTRAQLQASL